MIAANQLPTYILFISVVLTIKAVAEANAADVLVLKKVAEATTPASPSYFHLKELAPSLPWSPEVPADPLDPEEPDVPEDPLVPALPDVPLTPPINQLVPLLVK